MFRLHIRDGFEGQVHFVVPRGFLHEVESHPLLYTLFPTDIGYYPNARYHYREREHGTAEHILICCVAGHGWAKIRDTVYPVGPNEALLIPSGEPHIYSAALDDPWSIHWVHFRGRAAYPFAQLADGQYVIPLDETTRQPIVETFHECYGALSRNFGMQQMLFCALTIQRVLAWVFFANPAFQPAETTLPPAVDAALSFMSDNLHQRPQLNDIAAAVGLSASHFSYVFRQHMGVPPIDYFLTLKVQYACHLLDTTDMTVKQIALTLGYEDPYYFSRLFRKIMGKAPASYRKQGH